jgi:hypothetical protein
LQQARITSLMKTSCKNLPFPAKMEQLRVQQPAEICHCVQNKICVRPKSSSPLKRTVSKQLTSPTAQNSSSVIQINQPTRYNNFSSLLLDVYLQLNTFRAFLHPSSGAQQLH